MLLSLCYFGKLLPITLHTCEIFLNTLISMALGHHRQSSCDCSPVTAQCKTKNTVTTRLKVTSETDLVEQIDSAISINDCFLKLLDLLPILFQYRAWAPFIFGHHHFTLTTASYFKSTWGGWGQLLALALTL